MRFLDFGFVRRHRDKSDDTRRSLLVSFRLFELRTILPAALLPHCFILAARASSRVFRSSHIHPLLHSCRTYSKSIAHRNPPLEIYEPPITLPTIHPHSSPPSAQTCPTPTLPNARPRPPTAKHPTQATAPAPNHDAPADASSRTKNNSSSSSKSPKQSKKTPSPNPRTRCSHSTTSARTRPQWTGPSPSQYPLLSLTHTPPSLSLTR